MEKRLIALLAEICSIGKHHYGSSLADFANACLECQRTPWQETEINILLKKNSLDPLEVWSRFERRARRLNSDTCGRADEGTVHDFRRGSDFLHVIGDIWAEGRLPNGFLHLNLSTEPNREPRLPEG